jgi:hypothetical protein
MEMVNVAESPADSLISNRLARSLVEAQRKALDTYIYPYMYKFRKKLNGKCVSNILVHLYVQCTVYMGVFVVLSRNVISACTDSSP